MNQLTELQALLAKSEIFRGLTEAALKNLATYMTPTNFKKDELILEKNTIGDWMFVIKEGKVKVHNGSVTITVLGAGEVIGELSLLKPEVRNMSVTTLRETTAFRITHQDFFAFAEKNPKALTGIITILVDRLRNQTAATLRHFEEREKELTRLVEARTLDLQNKNLELERTRKFKEQFLANMSHEIRTPMNAILGMTNLVLDSELNNKQRHYLTSVQKASDNLLRIINEILNLSKMEAGKIELEKVHFSIKEVIELVAETLQHKAKEKDIELITKVNPRVPQAVIGDPGRLNQILMNIAGNAIKYTDKGSVLISVDKNEQGLLHFAVTDTGAGIPEDKLDSIFDSFSQANASDTRIHGGTGLGLTISKGFVELMGGKLKVKSVLGSGATFYFDLDLPLGSVEKMEEAQAHSANIDGSILNGLKILLAEDNEDNRIVCTDTLTAKAELRIDEAENGKEALEKLKENDYDLVLMDVQMPEMDGYTATTEIRNHFPEPKNKIPIIALTASVIRSDLDKCREVGMDDYVPKPFKPHQLFSTIAKLTGREIKYLKKAEPVNPQPVSPSQKVVDLTYLHEFCNNDRAKMQKYINLFLGAAPDLVVSLKTALAEDDFERLAVQVHSYKMQFMMMGMSEARQLSSDLELDCRQENPASEIIESKTKIIIEQTNAAIKILKGINFI